MNMQWIRYVLWSSALVLLASCSAGGKQFAGVEKPDSSYAQVYIYRPAAFAQSGIFPDIEMDSKLVGKLKNGGYLSAKVKPGDHKLAVTGNYLQWNYREHLFDVSFEGGKTYFYRLQPFTGPGGGYAGGVYLANYSYSFARMDDQAAALAELEKLKESVDK
ncbi:MAG TPA: DUF2846 domain-containing protein [Mariprofundaceae bacterium]|nr:DUF2846 domain-containing protein [Mariprofundaceae bacterium]